MFRTANGGAGFQTVREWNLWQVEEFARQLTGYLAEPAGAFLHEDAVRVQIGYKSRPLAPFHNGALKLYSDRIELQPETGGTEAFPIDDIRGANVQNNEHWEFYCGSDLFRITTEDPRGCTYKWNLAVTLLHDSRDKNRSVV